MGNNWKIVLRKWLLGTLCAAAVGALLHAIGLVEQATGQENAPAWLSYVGPLAIHYAGMLVNIVKHTKWWQTAQAAD